MKSFKKIIGQVHLWLGLASGLVVFIVSITGCLYSFQEEIQNVTQPFRFVEAQNKPFLRPSALEKIALKALPNKQLHAIMYSGKSQSAQAIFYHYEPSYYYITYLNPYNGEVLEVKDIDSDFFRIVLMGHYYLWLPPTIGQPIVATSTLVFVVMLISGIILWWPKNESAAKQRFWFRWKNTTKWKRKNYDLHNILGFYSAWIVLIIALTGLVWGFEWFANAVYGGLGGEKSTMYTEVFSDKKQKELVTKQSPAIDRIWYKMLEEQPLAKTIEVHIPESDSASLAVNVNMEEGTTWKIDYRYFDQYSLKELSVNHLYGRFPVDKVADKVLRMNYDIHVGAIFGLAGKVLAFLVSLVAASLPISGVLIWWGRRKKLA